MILYHINKPYLELLIILFCTATSGAKLWINSALISNLGVQVEGLGSDLLIVNGSAAQENYSQLLATVSYYNTDEEPVPPGETRQQNVEFNVFDDRFNAVAMATITLYPKNDPPCVSTNNTKIVYNERARVPINLFSSTDRITDSENDTISWVTIEIYQSLDNRDNLSLSVATDINVLQQSTTIPTDSNCFPFAANNTYQFLNFSGIAMPSSYEQILHNITFNNDCPDMNSFQRTVIITASDGISSKSINISINISEYDDPPLCYFGNWPVSELLWR